MTENPKAAVGDVVILRTRQGVKMVIIRVYERDGFAWTECAWQNETVRNAFVPMTAHYPAAALRKWSSEDPGDFSELPDRAEKDR